MSIVLLATFVRFSLGAESNSVSSPEDAPVPLPKLDVNEQSAHEDVSFDETGIGVDEEQLHSEPFSNDLISVDSELEEGLSGGLNTELAAISTPSPADAAAGESRLNLRGFPTPVLRNGFIQLGIPETLNVARTVVIQGPLVPVLGRAAPGGIQNFITQRPAARDRSRFETFASTEHRQQISWESTGALIKKKLWQRWAVDWQHKLGPEEFSDEENLSVSGALTYRHSRAASTLISVDYRHLEARVSPGIPEYKLSSGQRIIGPYLPLARFNANGPAAGVDRQSLVLGTQFESQLTRQLSLRAAVEGWWRAIDQDRFTVSQLVLDRGVFEGTREPRHAEQRQEALATHLELTDRFTTGSVEHKLLGYAGVTWGDYNREDRALLTADRNNLPLSVRQFNPTSPDYYSPAYTESTYARIITDRLESARYTALEASDRVAFAQGRTVVSAGVRLDEVDLAITDRRATASVPSSADRVHQISYHAGVNHQLIRNRLLAFASASTAFDPSTRVDARTGRIQGNETTLGYEAGLKGRTLDKRFDYSGSAFLLYNRNISRRNPLYDDPVFDANQTQPQLVAAGEERFAGLRTDLRYKLSDRLEFALRAVHLSAITTRSPAIGPEVGRQLTRLPEDTATLLVRSPVPKSGTGITWSAAWNYVGTYVSSYGDAQREPLAYPGYGLFSASTGYTWKTAARQLTLTVAVRNVLNRNLVASNARVGADREFGLTARIVF